MPRRSTPSMPPNRRSERELADRIRVLVVAVGTLASAQLALAADLSAKVNTPFGGKTAVSANDSVPDWPKLIKAPPGAPNIVLILLDDIGFADTSTFGGIAETPELDKLASQGLRYVNFNNASICSPTRAALLSGRNHHRVGFGGVPGVLVGTSPGYDTIWKKNIVSLPEVLRRNGYSTAAFGKWHNTPDWEVSSLGPFDRWPTGLGFEYFYGFMNPLGKENQWEPSTLYRGTLPVEPAATPQQGYHLTTDITNDAIHWLRMHESSAAEKPYFLYFATGAVHEPHQAPREWIDRYRGQFDRGWDTMREEIFARQKSLGVIPANAELTNRPAEVPAWSSLSADQKRLYARQMEVYTGFVAHTDHEVGRLLQAVRESRGAENTLILYLIGDNGSAPGGPNGFSDGDDTVEGQLKQLDELGSAQVAVNTYSTGFAWMGSTPFQYWKFVASHFGGTRDPMVVTWPGHIRDPGGVRRLFLHVNDVAATLYEAAGIHFPAVVDGVRQQPLDGVSFAGSFVDPAARSGHSIQYFEAGGNRAIYQDGWVAAARHAASDYDKDRWELYHVDDDFSEAHDLAALYPQKLKALQRLFDTEARRNDVYPLGGAHVVVRDPADTDEPSWVRGKQRFVFYPGSQRVPPALMPPLTGKSFRVAAQVGIPETGALGVILSYGSRASGFALYIQDGQLILENNVLNASHEVLSASAPPAGSHALIGYEFDARGPGRKAFASAYGPIRDGIGRLLIDGRVVKETAVTSVTMSSWNPGSLGVGQAFGSPVSRTFSPPFEFTGVLESVTVEIR